MEISPNFFNRQSAALLIDYRLIINDMKYAENKQF